MNTKHISIFSLPIIVAALGYFVDIYDLVLFGIFRKPSLQAIGLEGDLLESAGHTLINVQMIGMLVGGLFWGILGDKKGRLSVLFGSIITYSIANLLNAYVQTLPQYIIIRFVAGFGLAGELGAGITLVSELLKKEQRGWGTTFVATVGVSGAVFAGILGKYVDWKTGYIIGGVLGFALLLLRVGVVESGIYKNAKEHSNNTLGSLKLIFQNKTNFKTYMYCILSGLPVWYGVGILVFFSPELGKELNIQGTIETPLAITYAYIGVTLGDLASGMLSQIFKTRIKVMQWFIASCFIFVIAYSFLNNASVAYLYFVCLMIGFTSGYWAVIISTSAEQFGTNVRATVATSVPNFIRAALVPITFLYSNIFHQFFGIGKINSALITGLICCSIALWSVSQLKETFAKDLNYLEN